MWENILASSIVIGVMFSLVFAFYLFNSARAMKKSRDYVQSLHEKIKPEAKVLCANGLVGKILSIDGEFVQVEVAPKIILTVSLYGINEVLDK